MKNLIIVDTSVFVQYLRGDTDDTLAVFVLNNQVLLSPIVKLELLAGARSKDIRIVERLCSSLRQIESYPTPKDCEKLLHRARGSGLLGGIPDLFILADTLRHGAYLFSADKKMLLLAKKLGIHIVET